MQLQIYAWSESWIREHKNIFPRVEDEKYCIPTLKTECYAFSICYAVTTTCNTATSDVPK